MVNNKLIKNYNIGQYVCFRLQNRIALATGTVFMCLVVLLCFEEDEKRGKQQSFIIYDVSFRGFDIKLVKSKGASSHCDDTDLVFVSPRQQFNGSTHICMYMQ